MIWAAPVHAHHDPPVFDDTGNAYRERYDQFDLSVGAPSTFYWRLPYAPGDSLQGVVKNKVHVMRCNYYEREDTVLEESTQKPGMFNTVYRMGSFHEHYVWIFNEQGHMTRFADYSDTTEKSPRFTYDYTYDAQGFVTRSTSYALEDGISKQYRGYERRETRTYNWSPDHLICEVNNQGALISLSGTSKKERKYWDTKWNEQSHWELNSNAKAVFFRGKYLDHDCEIKWSYAPDGLLLKQTVLFTDCNKGYCDSIAWSHTHGKFGKHYFSLTGVPDHGAPELVEEFSVDNKAEITFVHRENGVAFCNDKGSAYGGDYMVDKRDNRMVAIYEVDSNDFFITKRMWDYTVHNENETLITENWFVKKDSVSMDTVHKVIAYQQQNGLLTAIDTKNFGRTFTATWHCPSFSLMDERSCYRFRYEYY